ncbi:zinc finger, C4 type [Oesophagostomum dentatum]|uniref:Zinc finger, C4 type n=1 Tax=Oesophagostomum dentatum TaxID=61180 RepID=A0A0B1SFB8_OESDE|nr:zinc finger, C4 type [Oesophagostomum dentatum]
MSADAQPNPKQRANIAYPPEPPIGLPTREKATVGALVSIAGLEFSAYSRNTSQLIQCVVCGDRACSHLYYGVAACHGCKCFFWRTVKSGLTYTCRFDGKCSISTG